MTSDTAKQSKAAQELQFVVERKHHISLSALLPKELNAFLASELSKLDLKELRGFKELREVISQHRDEVLMRVSERMPFCSLGFSEKYQFTLKSHVIQVSRGLLSQDLTYRRYESGEETNDLNVFLGWVPKGRGGYVCRGKEKVLFLWRTPDPLAHEDVLVEVEYEYYKVPRKDEFMISTIYATRVLVHKFSQHFGSQAPQVACNLLWEIATIYSVTVDSLENKVSNMREKKFRMQQLAGSIWSGE
jgi:hypothetical protein